MVSKMRNLAKCLALVGMLATVLPVMADGVKVLNGQNVQNVVAKLGEPDQVMETQSRQKVYAWAVTSAEFRYTGTPEKPMSSQVVTTVCMLQLLVNSSGAIKDSDIEGSVLPCAKLKKRLGLI